MSAADEVATLPGGQALAALAAQVRGNPGAIREIANSWTEAAGDCAGHAGRVRSAVSEVAHAWQGRSADAFAALMGRFGTAGSDARQALRAAATALAGAANALEAAQRSVESICENLLGEVARLRANNPRANPAQLNAVISGFATEAADAARGKVAEARQALERASAALSGDLSELNQTFAALPQPGSDGFTSWQTPAGWSPAAAQQPAGTLASTNPSTPTPTPAAPRQGGYGGGVPFSGGGGGGGGDVAASAGAGGGAYLTAASSSGGAPPGGGGGGPAPPGQVSGWIDQAIKILEAQGIPASKLSTADIWIIIQHESGGNPSAVNGWDSNAAAGHPSIGLMQTIGPTFNAYALPGHGNIYNPVDNIIAGVRYALARYGSLDSVPGVAAVHAGQPYVGY